MGHYDEQREKHEAEKERGITTKPLQPPTFEENIGKLLNLSKDKFKLHYENQMATYKEYIAYLKEVDGETPEVVFFEGLIAKNQECVAYVDQNNVLSYLSEKLKTVWSEGDILKMINFQDHATEMMNQYFREMEQMVEIDKYIDERGDMLDDVNSVKDMGRMN